MTPSSLPSFLASLLLLSTYLSSKFHIFLSFIPNYNGHDKFFRPSPEPLVNPSIPTTDQADPSTPYPASPPIPSIFKSTGLSPPISSTSHAILPTPKEQQQNYEIVPISPSSASPPESVKDLITISQQLFKIPSRHGAPASSFAGIDGKKMIQFVPLARSHLLMKSALCNIGDGDQTEEGVQ